MVNRSILMKAGFTKEKQKTPLIHTSVTSVNIISMRDMLKNYDYTHTDFIIR